MEWEREIGQLLDLLHDSAAKSNFDQYFECYSPSGCFIGTDATEHWTVSEFKEFSRPHFQKKSAWVYIPIEGRRSLYPFHLGDNLTNQGEVEGKSEESEKKPVMVSFDELLVCQSLNCEARGTGTIVWNSERRRWEILSYYLSFPIPDAVGNRVATIIGEHLTARPSVSMTEMKKLEADADAAAAELLAELDKESSKKSKSKSNNKKKGKGKR